MRIKRNNTNVNSKQFNKQPIEDNSVESSVQDDINDFKFNDNLTNCELTESINSSTFINPDDDASTMDDYPECPVDSFTQYYDDVDAMVREEVELEKQEKLQEETKMESTNTNKLNTTSLVEKLRQINLDNQNTIERVQQTLIQKATTENATEMDLNVTNEHLKFIQNHLVNEGFKVSVKSSTSNETLLNVNWAV